MKWAGEVAFFLIIVLVIAATFAAIGCIYWDDIRGFVSSLSIPELINRFDR